MEDRYLVCEELDSFLSLEERARKKQGEESERRTSVRDKRGKRNMGASKRGKADAESAWIQQAAKKLSKSV